MIYYFGACGFDRGRGEVYRAGEVIHLEPQCLVVLAYLVG